MGTINPVNKPFCLQQLFESNYRKIFRLIPGLLSVNISAIGYSAGKKNLLLEIIEKTPYTITVQFSHSFDSKPDHYYCPSIKVRIYMDMELVEVIRDHNQSDVSRKINQLKQGKAIVDYKWSLNYFLEKWLDHCLQQEYQFINEQQMAVEMS